MASKKLQLVGVADPGETPAPPRPLGEHGRKLWDTLLADIIIADIGSLEMLCLACQALDTAEQCREAIERDGPVIRSKTAGVRDHPALKHELANRAFVARTLTRLGAAEEALRPIGRPSGR